MPIEATYDYIVIGSGAGGGPLAANLARAGFKVLVMEAGADHGDRPTYQVPVFHGFATEDPNMRWDYFVQHYHSEALQTKDSKYDKNQKGVWYPRAGTLGGCTAHNAMITVYGHNVDWDRIAADTGDDSWNSANMRKYFERLERCEYVPAAADVGNAARHGTNGWLTTSKADAKMALADVQLLKLIVSAALQAVLRHVADPKQVLARLLARINLVLDRPLDPLRDLLQHPFDPLGFARALVDQVTYLADGLLDPNDWAFVRERLEGLVVVPLAVEGGIHDPQRRGRRNGPREYLLATQKECPNGGGLDIWTNVLATRIVFEADGATQKAVGVAYVRGEHLYGADPGAVNPNARPPLDQFRRQEQQVRAAREVIVAAGAFNTPQLLMLSGIGPRQQLTDQGIDCLVELPGVGQNLQDRYEVGVVSRMNKEFGLLQNAVFKAPEPGEPYQKALQTDPALKQWDETGTGVYATNGATVGIILRSDPGLPEPDLFIFGLPGFFKGYFQGYSKILEADRNVFTWAILKAKTKNTAGSVTLRSADPRDTPVINFNYFTDGNDQSGADLKGVIAGVKFVRELMAHPDLAGMVTKTELLPGVDIADDTAVEQFVQNEAWGHHASCTCPIGKADTGGVLDSRFRVHGTTGLRVVDASVFPHIPGFFVVTPIYMISEKATDVILEDAGRLPTNP